MDSVQIGVSEKCPQHACPVIQIVTSGSATKNSLYHSVESKILNTVPFKNGSFIRHHGRSTTAPWRSSQLVVVVAWLCAEVL
jgi:hypothetical protein